MTLGLCVGIRRLEIRRYSLVRLFRFRYLMMYFSLSESICTYYLPICTYNVKLYIDYLQFIIIYRYLLLYCVISANKTALYVSEVGLS